MLREEKNKKRIDLLRERPLNAEIRYDEFHMKFYRRFAENAGVGCLEERYADAYTYAFENLSLSIDDGELIVGKVNYSLTDEEKAEWEILKKETAMKTSDQRGQDSHMTVDLELVLREGLLGILEQVECRTEKLLESGAAAGLENVRFYASCAACLKAVIRFSDRYAQYALKLAAEESDGERRQELLEIARICAKVPAHPAETFYEAVQSVHFIVFALSMDSMRWFSHQQFQLGHPDRYLWRFYEADLAAGRINREEAQLLLDCLGIQINNRVINGLSSGYMVGGRDRNGQIVSNELTGMAMDVIPDNRLVFPAVGLCYTAETPDSDLEHACRIIEQGFSHPAIYNDDVITRGLMQYGVPEAEAHDYIHSNCVEITPETFSNVWVASPYHNLLRPLLDVMTEEMQREADAEDGHRISTMEELLDAVFQKLDIAIRIGFEAENENRRLVAERTIAPFLSCLVRDCLENGVDIKHGGARYNWIMPSFVGMSNLADSLTVLKQLVFEEQKYTIPEIRRMLDCNFEGYERQRLEMSSRVPKYGNDCEEADQWCQILTEHIVAECGKYQPMFQNGRLIPSVFCWIMHEKLGSETEASPDGRKAGFPLGDGSGPAQGREMNGPTASILSSTKWCHQDFIGGVAVNMKFSKKVFNDDSHRKMFALIKSYMQRGGFEIQINVLDRETLLDAQKHPELHRDLVVRIGGYSDYFVKIPENMQAEVLLRTEHEM